MKRALVAALLVGCAATYAEPPHHKDRWGGPCDRAYYVTPEFPANERAALDDAVARWNVIANEKFCLFDKTSSKHDEPHGVYRIPSDSEERRNLNQSFGTNLIGVYLSNDTIGIVSDLSAADFEVVALHEFGHAHGLSHVAAPAVMHASIGTATDFEPNDMTECRRVGACASGETSEDAGADAEGDEVTCTLHASTTK